MNTVQSALTKHIDSLTRALDSWKRERERGGHPPEKAREILDIVRKITNEDEEKFLEPGLWHEYLNVTGKADFLQNLNDRELCLNWAETTFNAIRASDYSVETLFKQRAAEYPRRDFFYEVLSNTPVQWSYETIFARVRAIAASFYKYAPDNKPRVAIFANNCIDSACADLACLSYDIINTPLNIHFDAETLTWIFNRLDINTAVTESEDLYHRLKETRRRTGLPFRVFLINTLTEELEGEDAYLEEVLTRLTPPEIETVLAKRDRIPLLQTATVMFTSGSTGAPKGVAFSIYNIITKRFARAAALPDVGEEEVLLCYLPLFHTFGRYLEMMGMLYWGGTYVFTGNPSFETLLARMADVHPTGLIGIPLRWMQIHDECLARMRENLSPEAQEKEFRAVVGKRLHWGLSAAGFLSPKTFRFFHRNGVELSSGFGMTEATGGITMTPPGEYMDKSVGIPLPGISYILTEAGELHIAGPYIAKYLHEDKYKQNDVISGQDNLIETGDLFQLMPNGHFMIVDRIKDIYKNNRGQTIAPRRVEEMFNGVPGIKRSFLVGDGRDYNVLLIVPEMDDQIFKEDSSDENVRTYMDKISSAVNQELAPYERIVNLAILDRDFNIHREELTPKGTFRRKVIENNFEDVIDSLYQSNYVELFFRNLKIVIPRWFFRDQGVLEGDIEVQNGGLYNRSTKQFLPLGSGTEPNAHLIGDLEYILEEKTVNLGLFARQPKLWVGNPALIGFCPCKAGWDLPLRSVGEQVFLPWRQLSTPPMEYKASLLRISDQLLAYVNERVVRSLFGPVDAALEAAEELGEILTESDDRIAGIIRRRLETLARHPAENVRCFAYRILLLEEPILDYSKNFPAFVISGLTFLNEESIEAISQANMERRRLEALRQRLHSYRIHLPWPTTNVTRQQFERIFKLLVNFVKHNSGYYNPVRAELNNWILHDSDMKLSATAERLYNELVRWYESKLAEDTPEFDISEWRIKIIFGEEISPVEIDRIENVIIETTFLKQSIMIAFDIDSFDLNKIKDRGIWISRILCRRHHNLYRISINTVSGIHYDLLLIIRRDIDTESVRKTKSWMIAIAGHPYGLAVLPRFGCFRPELSAMSVAYLNELTAWDKLRELSVSDYSGTLFPRSHFLRKIFIRSIATFFTGWRNSNYKILPGSINLENVVVPELDFSEASSLISLTGWSPYDGPLSLVKPMLKNFFKKTTVHYPWTEQHLRFDWLFEACIESLGMERGKIFLKDLRRELEKRNLTDSNAQFYEGLTAFLERLPTHYFVPFALKNAVDHYAEWEYINPNVTKPAREELVGEIYRIYRIDRYPEIAHYYLYRHTYFAKADPPVLQAFDDLLYELFRHPHIPATRMLELSHLQSAIKNAYDRNVFSRMVFPWAKQPREVDVMTVGEHDEKHVVVLSQILDKQGKAYNVREPIEPAEIGQIYRLFIREKIPRSISEHDRFIMATDSQDRIIGAVCYKTQGKDIAALDSIAVSGPLKNQGIGGALLEDFCIRLANLSIKVIKTHYFVRKFFMSHGFQVDKRWGGLVRFLAPLTPEDADENISRGSM